MGNRFTTQRYAVSATNYYQPIQSVDMDQDGRLDLIIATKDQVDIRYGTGTGFSAPQVLPAKAAARFKAEDLNGDTLPDLAIAGGDVSTVTVILNQGQRTYSAPRSYISGIPEKQGNKTLDVAIVDFNGDGKLDLAAANFSSNTISIFNGQGDGTFQNQTLITVPSLPVQLEMGDLNRDGTSDLLVLGNDGHLQALLLHQSGTHELIQRGALRGGAVDLNLIDINQDGILDVVALNSYGTHGPYNNIGTTVDIFSGASDGTFTLSGVHLVDDSALRNSRMALADMNGDGLRDVVLVNQTMQTLSILEQERNGTFKQVFTAPVRFLYGGISVLDLNGDGKNDIALQSAGNAITIYTQK